MCDDAAWEQWADGNPFDHEPSDEEAGPEVGFGPRIEAATGPESDPEALSPLPRRTAVREADPEDRPDEDGLSAGLAGIAGFHSPVAEAGQHDTVLEEAINDPQQDPNAAWLENLYAQFIDEAGDKGRSTKKEALDVAFQADEQAATEKVGTLRRLVDALRRV